MKLPETLTANMKHTNGFSYIEVIIVITILVILGMLSVPFASNFSSNTNLTTTKDQLISSLRKAQIYAMDGKLGSQKEWGVCIIDSKIRLYYGECETPDFQENFQIANGINVTGFTDTKFSALRGEPDSFFNITIVSNTKTVDLTLNEIGGLDQ